MTTAIPKRSPEGTLPSRRRLTYEEVIDYIARDPDKIKYPDRKAKFLRNSFELSFLDALNFEQLQEQQLKAQKFQVGQMAIQQAAVDRKTSAPAESAISLIETPMPVPSAPPQNLLPLPMTFGRGMLKLATAAARGVVGAGADLIDAAINPPVSYTFPTPPQEEDTSFGTALFGTMEQHMARQQAVADSHWFGGSSSSSWGAEPEPRVAPPGDTEVARQWDMRLLKRIEEEQRVPNTKRIETGKESLKEVEGQNDRLVPYTALAGHTTRAMASMLLPR